MSDIAIDSSAIIELLTKGPRSPAIQNTIAAADLVVATPVTRVETALVMIGRFGWQRSEFDLAWNALGLEEVSADTVIGSLAITAFESFGKGRAKAALNFGDCFSYALAATRHVPLLYIGDDFSRTDLQKA